MQTSVQNYLKLLYTYCILANVAIKLRDELYSPDNDHHGKWRERVFRKHRKDIEKFLSGELPPLNPKPINAAALINPIANQYVKIGTAMNFTFPANTFEDSSALTFTAFENRPIIGRDLPSWMTFTDNLDGTGTFSGTPTDWFHAGIHQLVVEADDGVSLSYCIFILYVGDDTNTGTVPWRAGDTPDYDLTLANIGGFNPASVSAGEWVAIGTDITRETVPQATKDKINTARTNGARIVWKWNNNNGLRAHLTNYMDFTLVEAGDSIGVDFSAGNTRAFNPHGLLHKGLPGKPIFVTNYNAPGYIQSRNWQDFQNVNAIRNWWDGTTKQDKHIVYFGQPNNHTPFVNLYGLGVREGITWQVDGSQGWIEASYMQLADYNIGFHWKPNLTVDRGDRRAGENVSGWDFNQEHLYIRNCFSPGGKGEVVYLGSGGWQGANVTTSIPEFPGESWRMKRFNATHNYVRVEHNIFLQSGWDAIQTRVVAKEQRIMYNYCYETAFDPSAINVQAEGIIVDGVGEIAYNWVEKAYFSAIRANMLGLDSIHHNICIDTGQDNYSNPNLNAAQAGTSVYASNRGLVNEDIPQWYIGTNYQTWSSATTYNYDNTVHPVKVKLNGKSYRSKQANNLNHNPETSPTWWEDTREWVSYNARPDIDDADLFFKLFNNTFINSKYTTVNIAVATPVAQRWVMNNLFINCNSTSVSGGVGSNTSNNIAEIGVTLANYFTDPANGDYRLKAGASAIGAGSALGALVTNPLYFSDGFLDYSGGAHASPPSCGAFEDGAAVGDHYSWAVNGQIGGGTPAPFTINAGPDLNLVLPLDDGVAITAVKSDSRTLTSIQWTQISGPSTLTLTGATTLTLQMDDFVEGQYRMRITVIDEFDQESTDDVILNISSTSIYSSFQWYVADDSNGTNKTAIPGATERIFDPTAYVGQGKYFQLGERPVAQSGTILGIEYLSNWVLVS